MQFVLHSPLFALIVLTCSFGHGLTRSFESDASLSLWQRFRQHQSAKKNHDSRFSAFVKHFSISQKNAEVSNSKNARDPFSSFLIHGMPMKTQQGSHSSKVAAPFRWTSCGPSQQIMDIKSLSLTPDPLSFPGTLTISFDIAFRDTISEDDNVTVALQIYEKVSEQWLLIPCIGPVGSCTYVDFCQLIQPNTCPQDFTAQGVPCKCPFTKGEYKLTDFSIDIDAAVMIPGDYKGRLRLSSGRQGSIACYELYLSVV